MCQRTKGVLPATTPPQCSFKFNQTRRTYAVQKHALFSEDIITWASPTERISCVVASVAEAELGAAFQNAQKAAEFRNTLHKLGYPQQATTNHHND